MVELLNKKCPRCGENLHIKKEVYNLGTNYTCESCNAQWVERDNNAIDENIRHSTYRLERNKTKNIIERNTDAIFRPRCCPECKKKPEKLVEICDLKNGFSYMCPDCKIKVDNDKDSKESLDLLYKLSSDYPIDAEKDPVYHYLFIKLWTRNFQVWNEKIETHINTIEKTPFDLEDAEIIALYSKDLKELYSRTHIKEEKKEEKKLKKEDKKNNSSTKKIFDFFKNKYNKEIPIVIGIVALLIVGITLVSYYLPRYINNEKINRYQLEIINNNLNYGSTSELTIKNNIVTACKENTSGEIYIPDGVVEIADNVFKNCGWLKYIRIPESVNYIGENNFFDSYLNNGNIRVDDNNVIYVDNDISNMGINNYKQYSTWFNFKITNEIKHKLNEYKSCKWIIGSKVNNEKSSNAESDNKESNSYIIENNTIGIAYNAFRDSLFDRLEITDSLKYVSSKNINENIFGNIKSFVFLGNSNNITNLIDIIRFVSQEKSEIKISSTQLYNSLRNDSSKKYEDIIYLNPTPIDKHIQIVYKNNNSLIGEYVLKNSFNSLSDLKDYLKSDAVNLENIFTQKIGYDYNYFYVFNDEEEELTDNNFSSSIDMNIIIKENLVIYTIEYELNDANNDSHNPSSYTIETDNILLGIPTKTGYFFEGWFDSDSYSNKITSIEKGNHKNYILYAKWRPIQYVIYYELAQGNNDDLNPDTYTIDQAINLRDPYRDGYDFVGWYDKNYINKITQIQSGSIGDIYLYAQWSLKIYSIEYELNNGTNNINNPKEYTFEQSVEFKVPTREGFSFIGWYDSNLYTNKITSISKGSYGNKKLYAKWEAISIGINLQYNDICQDGSELKMSGENHTINVSYDDNMAIQIPQNSLSKYYRFVGYYDSRIDGSKITNELGIPITIDDGEETQTVWHYTDEITLYAQWEKIMFDGQKAYTYIANVRDMQNISKDKSGTYILIKDINLGEWNNPFGFCGHFNGDNHKITYSLDIVKKGITKHSNGKDYLNYDGGLFNDLYDGALVENLIIECSIKINDNVNRTFSEDSRGRVGGVAGLMWSNSDSLCPKIQNITISGDIVINNETVNEYNSDTGVGGVVGVAYCGEIQYCKSTVKVFVAEGCVGGIVGKAWMNDGHVTINNCTYIGSSYDLTIHTYYSNSSRTIYVCSVACLYGGSGGLIGYYKSNNKNYVLTTYNNFVNSSVGRSTGGGTGGCGAIVGNPETWNYWDRINCYYTNRCGFAINGNRSDFSSYGLIKTDENKDMSNR